MRHFLKTFPTGLVIVSVAFALFVMIGRYRYHTNFDQIKIGMTQANAEELLGQLLLNADPPQGCTFARYPPPKPFISENLQQRRKQMHNGLDSEYADIELLFCNEKLVAFTQNGEATTIRSTTGNINGCMISQLPHDMIEELCLCTSNGNG
jgi:hypothetical protein